MSNLKEYKFNELYKMDSGINTSKSQAGHGAPFVSFRDIYNNPILPDELTEKMDTSDKEQEKYSVKKGDVFLTRTSEVLDELAMSSVAIKDYPNATFSGFAKRLRPIQNDITYDKFMAFYLRSNYFRKIVNAKAVMTLRASFNENIFSYIRLMLPDYNSQVKIGDLFYALECKIRNNNKINENLETMAKTIYDYWFLQFEFPNEEGKPYKSSGGKMVWNDELKREIPEGWENGNFSDLIEIGNGRDHKELQDGKIPVYGSGGVMRLVDTSIYDGESVLIPRKGTLNNVIYVNGAFWTVDTMFYSKMKMKHIAIFTYYSAKLYDFEKFNTGTGVPSMTSSIIYNLKTVIPTNQVLKDFDEIAQSLYKQIHKNNIENRELTSFRDFLLPLLMNGQIGFRE